MPTTLQSIAVLAAFLLPGFLAGKIRTVLSTDRKQQLHEFILYSLFFSLASHLVLYPIFKDNYHLSIQCIFDIKSQSQKYELHYLLVILSIFVVPVLLGFWAGIASRLGAVGVSISAAYWLIRKVFRTNRLELYYNRSFSPEVWDSVFDSTERQNEPWISVTIGDYTYRGKAAKVSAYPDKKQIYMDNVSILKGNVVQALSPRLVGILLLLRDTDQDPQAIEIYD